MHGVSHLCLRGQIAIPCMNTLQIKFINRQLVEKLIRIQVKLQASLLAKPFLLPFQRKYSTISAWKRYHFSMYKVPLWRGKSICLMVIATISAWKHRHRCKTLEALPFQRLGVCGTEAKGHIHHGPTSLQVKAVHTAANLPFQRTLTPAFRAICKGSTV